MTETMSSPKHQHGASFIVWVIGIAIVAFAVTVGIKLVPVYLQAYTVGSILEDVATESRGKKRNRRQIWSSVSKRLNINSIDSIDREQLSIERDGDMTTLTIAYEVRTHLIGNLDGVVNFKRAATFEN